MGDDVKRQCAAAGPRLLPQLDAADRATISQWLLGQQYREEHPYTHAPPGAWAWTDLSGGVPDADDTPGALLALDCLLADDVDGSEAAEAAVGWLLDLQNRDGGIPTFCRGWGNLPFDRSSADLTAHAIRAWSVWRNRMPASVQSRIDQAMESRDLLFSPPAAAKRCLGPVVVRQSIRGH